MFKCWIFMSGENKDTFQKEECLSDKSESYAVRKDTSASEDESKKITSYIFGMGGFGSFERRINF